MKLLLDTHVLLWALTNDPHLPARARMLIEDLGNDVCYSAIAPWEVQIKHQLHPHELTVGAREVVAFCKQAGFRQVPVRAEHAELLESLTRPEDAPEHRDPFDRMMICQATSEGMFFLTHDRRIAEYDEPCILQA